MYNITLYIAFGIICGRSWNVLPADKGALLYTHKKREKDFFSSWASIYNKN
jgi:hypothetical protein